MSENSRKKRKIDSQHNLNEANENNDSADSEIACLISATNATNSIKTKPAVSTSKFMDYFKFETRNEESVAICLECQKEKKPEKVVKRTSGNTTGLRKHLQNYHPKIFAKDNVKISGQKTINETFQTNVSIE